MLELQKIFVIVRFFNQISCNKGLKAKISCFFLVFFLFQPPLRLECSRIRKIASFLMSHRLKKYKNFYLWWLWISIITIVLLLQCYYTHLSIVFFFCSQYYFSVCLGIFCFSRLPFISINTISSWLVASCFLSVSLVS